MSYKVTIADVTELTEEVQKVEFNSIIPTDSSVRSANIETIVKITGRISYDGDKLFMRDAAKKIAVWSMVKPESVDSYKKVTVEYIHTDAPRKYEFSHAFVVSYHEEFAEEAGNFVLVIKQKKARLDGVGVE
jgi:hypothetical protein